MGRRTTLLVEVGWRQSARDISTMLLQVQVSQDIVVTLVCGHGRHRLQNHRMLAQISHRIVVLAPCPDKTPLVVHHLDIDSVMLVIRNKVHQVVLVVELFSLLLWHLDALV